ncbi:tRNA-queuosine alpha-mannosyltransferase domain-containing protein [Marinobacter mobilis]|uniref:tRNA-queuosine alpha-mannosyltransferase domain-containing protein n=1 Tax=Marinobacter mobilis TaxID=488533 RepID=UPI0035C76241
MSASSRPRILLLSGYDVGSHRRWREQLVASQPEFDWQVLSLPPRHFRWRIRGNALSWLDEPLLRDHWDLLVVTSMVDLATLKGFQPQLAAVPTLLYMHENQFAYPVSAQQHSSIDPQLVNLYSAIAANRVAFNSEWNRRSFLDSVAALLNKLPDAMPVDLVERLRAKSRVLPVPIDDSLFVDRTTPLNRQQPHLLWNHRWEYDKGPDRLFNLLEQLVRLKQPFRLSVVGEQFRARPASFDAVQDAFSEQIEHWGYLDSVADYHRLLASADVVVSTAVHDFQGLAMLEAMASGCLALAPERLAYPEYVPPAQCYPDLEADPETEARAAAEALVAMLRANEQPEPPEAWRLSQLGPQYRELLWEMLAKGF